MLTETYFVIAAAWITIAGWFLYYKARKKVVEDNQSHRYPEKPQNSTRIWIINSLLQCVSLASIVFLPFKYITSRPEQQVIIPTNILEFITILLVVIAAFAIGAHAISVYLFEFIDDGESRLHAENELFHGPLSHIPPYLAIIFFTWIFALLERQHPLGLHISLLQRSIIIVCGVITGMGLSASGVIAAVGNSIFQAAFINTALWFLWISGQFDEKSGPVAIFTITINITLIACAGVFRKQFKKGVYKLYDGPVL